MTIFRLSIEAVKHVSEPILARLIRRCTAAKAIPSRLQTSSPGNHTVLSMLAGSSGQSGAEHVEK